MEIITTHNDIVYGEYKTQDTRQIKYKSPPTKPMVGRPVARFSILGTPEYSKHKNLKNIVGNNFLVISSLCGRDCLRELHDIGGDQGKIMNQILNSTILYLHFAVTDSFTVKVYGKTYKN